MIVLKPKIITYEDISQQCTARRIETDKIKQVRCIIIKDEKLILEFYDKSGQDIIDLKEINTPVSLMIYSQEEQKKLNDF